MKGLLSLLYEDSIEATFFWLLVSLLFSIKLFEVFRGEGSLNDRTEDALSNKKVANSDQYFLISICLFIPFFIFIIKPLSDFGTALGVEKILSYFSLTFLFSVCFSFKNILSKLGESNFAKYFYFFVIAISIHLFYAAFYEIFYINDNASYKFIDTENSESRQAEMDLYLDKRDKLLERVLTSKSITLISQNNTIVKTDVLPLSNTFLIKNFEGDKINYYLSFNGIVDSSFFNCSIERHTPPSTVPAVNLKFIVFTPDDTSFIKSSGPMPASDEFSFEYEILSEIYQLSQKSDTNCVQAIIAEKFTALTNKYLDEIRSINNHLSLLDANSITLSYFDFLLFALHTSSWIGHGIIIPNKSLIKILAITQVFITLFIFIVLVNLDKVEVKHLLNIRRSLPKVNKIRKKEEEDFTIVPSGLLVVDGIGPVLQRILLENPQRPIKNIVELTELSAAELLEIIQSKSKRKYTEEQAELILSSARKCLLSKHVEI